MKSKIKSFYSSILHAYSKLGKNVTWLIILFLVTAISQFVLFALITRSLGKEYYDDIKIVTEKDYNFLRILQLKKSYIKPFDIPSRIIEFTSLCVSSFESNVLI